MTGLTRDLSIWSLVLNILTNILLAIHGRLIQDTGIFGIGLWFAIYWLTLFTYKWRNISAHSSL